MLSLWLVMELWKGRTTGLLKTGKLSRICSLKSLIANFFPHAFENNKFLRSLESLRRDMLKLLISILVTAGELAGEKMAIFVWSVVLRCAALANGMHLSPAAR